MFKIKRFYCMRLLTLKLKTKIFSTYLKLWEQNYCKYVFKTFKRYLENYSIFKNWYFARLNLKISFGTHFLRPFVQNFNYKKK